MIFIKSKEKSHVKIATFLHIQLGLGPQKCTLWTDFFWGDIFKSTRPMTKIFSFFRARKDISLFCAHA